MEYFFKRLFSDRRSNFIFLLFFVLMLIDVFMLYKSFGGYAPNYSTFLAGNSEGHYAQMLLLWLLPVYLVFGASYWSLSDFNSGNLLSIMIRKDRKYYWKVYNQVNFFYGFCLMFLSAVINYGAVTIIFRKEKAVPFMVEHSISVGDFQTLLHNSILWELSHPGLSNWIHIIMGAVITGCMSVIISTVNIFTKSIYYTVFIVISIWYLLISITPSIMVSFQPFTEYTFSLKFMYLISIILLMSICLIIQRKWWLNYDFV
ncbi:hypothetical protein UAY_03211 [Enterococcus moraviensis ATCC BAA-383]|uniref:Uncharacterized protein n=1 Tax=Enterococcus moraviensis ATCC BAA-383 TaxID=1158609 RepID=R2SKT6_9ENTE|nr:hypothetical protein [Enterococcus moraviensis]EOH95785.1 hypothetical protein UAY_03211 [Enterococcus moraviensis ATCC BAA-383]EOT66272.1 hypothetical protein I586_02543 [Enterococcus moraviensis ATCC BAA-383]OJG67664.1 hypothetical protein RV09_GL002433 [Enterococcus moraviensis]